MGLEVGAGGVVSVFLNRLAHSLKSDFAVCAKAFRIYHHALPKHRGYLLALDLAHVSAIASYVTGSQADKSSFPVSAQKEGWLVS